MYLLIPGRHHILTDFQFKYLFKLINSGLEKETDVFNEPLGVKAPIKGIVFAVTSANHSGTKRNPIPFYLRAMMIQEFSKDLSVPVYAFGINDVGTLDDFAGYTLKTIYHESEHLLNLTPSNTVVVCSTQVMDMYLKKNFKVLPAELEDRNSWTFKTDLPWNLVEKIVKSQDWKNDEEIQSNLHISSFKIWNTYLLADKVKTLLSDPIIGDDGDITETRDYNSYVRQMDEIAELKFMETSPYIKSGRIGDIGCAVGSWIKLVSEDMRFKESDFYGIEVARLLFDICNQRKHNGEFSNPSVFFAKKNAVTSLVFEENSMDTIHTSSLTHEIESYGSRQDLLDFIHNRHKELKPGGVWINRDVVGPEDGDREILMKLDDNDGLSDDYEKQFSSEKELADYLDELSTFSRFLRFARDFRRKEGYQLKFEIVKSDSQKLVKLKFKDAADFILTKDYTDNWSSEMHETFCFWGFSDWKEALEKSGFRIRSESNAYQNPWIVKNRWEGKVAFFDVSDPLSQISFPPTNMLMIAEKL